MTVGPAAIGAILLIMLSSSAAPQRSTRDSKTEIDHVILGINDLESGIAEFERLTGVKPERGGEHPGRGTQNALASLAEGRYLEIIAPLPSAPKPAASSFTRLTPTGWALRSGDLVAVVAKLGAAGFGTVGPTPGSRRRPDGTLLEWQTANATGAGLDLAPFFIHWAATAPHPSTTSPAGCRLAGVEIANPQPEMLARFFDAVGFKVDLRVGEPSLRVELQCPKGRLSFKR